MTNRNKKIRILQKYCVSLYEKIIATNNSIGYGNEE